jgi:hypothetical protein
MISNWVNTARALKALYDLSFSEAPFYVNSRAGLRDGVRHTIAQFQAGLNKPLVEEPPLIRESIKIMLYVLLALCFIAIILGGR